MTFLSGFASSEATLHYKDLYASQTAEGHFRERQGIWFSSIGIGSYLGEPDDETDLAYEEALKEAVLSGVNVIDSAINYRAQRSERSFGRMLQALTKSGLVHRDEVIVCTKGGFLPFDGGDPSDASSYFKKTYVETGILKTNDIVQGCHAMTPSYLEDQLERSLENLGLKTIDIYYLHNPETQLAEVDRKTFLVRMRKAFEWLEEKVGEGKIRWYGTATWNGYRVPPQNRDYLSLQDMVLLAREAGGAEHHFKFVQLPLNLAMLEAWILENQPYGANVVPLLGMAERMGIHVIGSGSLLQAQLAGPLPESFTAQFPGLRTPAQCSLQFVRSVPGMTTSLVGMKNKNHVRENLEVLKRDFLTENDLLNLFQQKSG